MGDTLNICSNNMNSLFILTLVDNYLMWQ